jgi:hypothetical protein
MIRNSMFLRKEQIFFIIRMIPVYAWILTKLGGLWIKILADLMELIGQ